MAAEIKTLNKKRIETQNTIFDLINTGNLGF